jgi:TnpA family transposase
VQGFDIRFTEFYFKHLSASGKVRIATPLPPYFGYGEGVTFYTWSSDQLSQYGTKVASSTIRDSTYVLDEILNNETELPIPEHTTDTAGFTDLG